jgi:trans-aconitate 2-methyltransferase
MPLHGISNCRLSAVTQWHGENYRDIATLQRSIASKTLAGLVLEGYECALDVGCSDGTITMQLAERVSPRTGARNRYLNEHDRLCPLAASWPNVDSEVNDVLTIRYCQEFDLVVSFNALHWVHDLGLAFQRITGALIHGDRAMLQFACAGDRPTWNKSLRQRVRASAGVSRSNRFDNRTNIGPPSRLGTGRVGRARRDRAVR